MTRRLLNFYGDVAVVPLTRGLVSIIDAADAHHADGYNWYASGDGYASRKLWIGNGQKLILLHRLIIGAQDGLYVDHVNGDRLDNRRSNLREATNSQNQANARKRSNCGSAFKGVTWNEARGRWQAQIKRGGLNRYLGLFETEQAAHEAYVAAASIVHGEFARSA